MKIKMTNNGMGDQISGAYEYNNNSKLVNLITVLKSLT